MYPVNQVFLGNSDPLLSQSDITSQMQILKQYEAQLAQLQKKGTLQTDLIWDDIDKEMSSLTESQKARFFEDQEYSEITAGPEISENWEISLKVLLLLLKTAK